MSMSPQLDLFATPAIRDVYTLSVSHVAATTTPTDGASVDAVPLACYAVAHRPRRGSAASDPTSALALPPALSYAAAAPTGGSPVMTMDGRLLSVPEPWTPADRLATLQHLVHDGVGMPVHWRRVATPRTAGLDPRRTGNLYRVGGDARDVIVHVHGGDAPDERQGRVSLHTTRAIAEEMGRYRRAVQCVVTRVRRPGRLDALVVAAIPWDVLAPIVADRLATGGGSRASVQCEITCTDAGVLLRIPEADWDVSCYAGVGAIAAALQDHPGEPWRAWSHPDWMAVVASVLTLRDGLHCSVAPLDARKLVTRSVLDELGIQGVRGHRLELPAASREALGYADLLAATRTRELRRDPTQPVVAVEIDLKSRMTAVQELGLRLDSAARLGLTVPRGVVVADEGKRDLYEERLALLRTDLRERIAFWPMDQAYAAYEAVRAEHLARRIRARRAAVRRAA